MVMSAARQYDMEMPCGAAAKAGKYLAGEAGFQACEQAVTTPWRLRLRQGIPGRALFARSHDPADRTD